MRTKKLLKPIDQEQPIVMRSLAECGEAFDRWAEEMERDSVFAFRVQFYGITLEDGWVMPIMVILN